MKRVGDLCCGNKGRKEMGDDMNQGGGIKGGHKPCFAGRAGTGKAHWWQGRAHSGQAKQRSREASEPSIPAEAKKWKSRGLLWSTRIPQEMAEEHQQAFGSRENSFQLILHPEMDSFS